MRIVAALGGNALLRRGQPMSADNQRESVKRAAEAMAPLALEHGLIVTHGNGPQVGLLALQGEAYRPEESFPLDVLDAETEGMIGYLIEQELNNCLPVERRIATLLTQIEVDPEDPAFRDPSKFIGPVYGEMEAEQLALERGWTIKPDGDNFRRVVPSPAPQRILEINVIEMLADQGVIVVCTGGGGIPVIYQNNGSLIGVEAVIDKDRSSALLACELAADFFLMLTDVEAVYTNWGQSEARAIRRASPSAIAGLSFAAGSMGPKIEAACDFVERTGREAGIGCLDDAMPILNGEAGTLITQDVNEIVYWD